MFGKLRNLLALPCNAIACKRNLKRAGLVPKTHLYATHDGYDLSLDLYLPEVGLRPCPAILFLHGGGWSAGDRTLIEPVALAQVFRGFALASVDYRLSGTAKWPAQLHDVRAAMRWLRCHAEDLDLNSQRICAFGVSAGGHPAAMLGTAGDIGPERDGTDGDVPAKPDSVIALYPPTDFLNAEPVGFRFMQAQAQLIDAPIHEAIEATESASPLNWISGGEPPFLLLHGEADLVVDPGQSARLEDALRAAEIKVTRHCAPGLHHADMRFSAAPWRQVIERFLDDPLANAVSPDT